MIYHDPVKDFRKVSDFDVEYWRPGIRELWERAATAAILAETVLFSQGGGENWPEVRKLAGSVLDSLNGAAAEICPRIAVYFLWHWAQILGARPDLSCCASCAAEVKRDAVLWYSSRKESLFCEKCAQNPDSLLRIDPSGRLWLMGIESVPPAALETQPVDTPSFEQAKALSQAVLTEALGRRLPTWEEL
jgi:DNA repair protein RecO (recombination protein O)